MMTERDAMRRRAWCPRAGGLLISLTAALAVVAGAQTDRSSAQQVAAVDLERCVQTYFPQATILRQSAAWGAGLQAVLLEPDRRERFELTVGIFGSAPEAAASVAALLRDLPVRCAAGSLTGAAVGDACWNLPGTAAEGTPSLMLFHRDNVLVRIRGVPREHVQDVAERLDHDMMEGAAHVRRGAEVIRPAMAAAAIPEGIRVGEEVPVAVTVSPGLGGDLYYTYALEGGVLLGGDPPRPMRFRPHTPGEHLLRFCVVDELCLVSPVAQIPVAVLE